MKDKWTIVRIMALKPCDPPYTREYVTRLFAGREAVTLLDILNADIPNRHKAWVFYRPGVMDDAVLKKWTYTFVDRAVKQYCLKCGNVEIERWAENWLSRADRTFGSAWDARALQAVRAETSVATDATWWAERLAGYDQIINDLKNILNKA